MEFRALGNSGLKVPVLSFGTATFGGSTEFFKNWGTTQISEARRLVDICLESGLNLFDTANVYSDGMSEEILGQAIEGRRHELLISTKATFPMGSGGNDFGSSRQHILNAVDASLKRLRTDHIDIYTMHGFDALTPVEETLRTLDDLTTSGKVRYIGCSNFSGWHLMKSLSVSEKNAFAKYSAHQVYYSLVGREYEWELMPLAKDQGVGAMIWSPLAGGALTGKFRRGKPAPANTRIGSSEFIPYDSERLYKIIDVLDEVAEESGKTLAQISLNWLLQRPTVSSLVVGARNEEQLRQNLGAVGWKLTPTQIAKLDAASSSPAIYPYWHQQDFPQLMPPLV